MASMGLLRASLVLTQQLPTWVWGLSLNGHYKQHHKQRATHYSEADEPI